MKTAWLFFTSFETERWPSKQTGAADDKMINCNKTATCWRRMGDTQKLNYLKELVSLF